MSRVLQPTLTYLVDEQAEGMLGVRVPEFILHLAQCLGVAWRSSQFFLVSLEFSIGELLTLGIAVTPVPS